VDYKQEREDFEDEIVTYGGGVYGGGGYGEVRNELKEQNDNVSFSGHNIAVFSA